MQLTTAGYYSVPSSRILLSYGSINDKPPLLEVFECRERLCLVLVLTNITKIYKKMGNF